VTRSDAEQLDAAAVAAASSLLLRSATRLAEGGPVAGAGPHDALAALHRPPPRADGKLQCQRRGCGVVYGENNNSSSACVFHPGDPVFTGTIKQWSCCGARGATFAEFSALRGCCVDHHSQQPTEAESDSAAEAPRQPRPAASQARVLSARAGESRIQM
jgi:hypothetical protein